MGRYLDELKARNAQAVKTEQRQRPTEGSNRVRLGAGWSALTGAADTMTFGYMDEFYGGIDAAGNAMDSALGFSKPFFGSGNGYAATRDSVRSISEQAAEDHPYAYGAGQLAGGVFDVAAGGAKLAGYGLEGVAGMAGIGAGEGALYGSGSADGGIDDRIKSALVGGALGGAGGWMLGKYIIPGAKIGLNKALEFTRWGKAPKLTTDFAVNALKPDVAEGAAATELGALRKEINTGLTEAERKGEQPLVNAITGKSGDEIEEGALFSMRELLGDPQSAGKALEKRLGKMTAIEVTALSNKLEKSIADGAQIDDPHFRSLLGFDIDDPNVTTDMVYKAVRIMEDGIDKVLAKAGDGPRTNASMIHEADQQLKQGVLEKDLKAAWERSKQGIPDQIISQHAELYAGVQFIRAKDKFLPLVKKGVEGSREQLAEALTKAAHIMAMARGIGGNAGRSLQVRKAGGLLKLKHVADDVFDMESIDQVRERVNGAIKELGDDQLGNLIDQLRNAEKLQDVADVLMDPERAKQWGAWNRTVTSMSSWLRSNALTPATGIMNVISFVGHDWFRNDLAKAWAARAFEKAGQMDDALAMRFEREIGNRVYMEAHKRGVKAMLDRVKWEGWDAIEKIGGIVGGADSNLSAKAKLARSTMLDNGYAAPGLREFENKPGIGVTDTAAYNQRLADRSEALGGGAFANLVNAADRAFATARTVVDEAGKASMKLFTGAVDDYGSSFVKLKETYALSARYAIQEALARGQNFQDQKEMLAWAQKRAVELAEMPPSEILQQVETKLADVGNLDDDPTLQFLMDRMADTDKEAKRVLLQDGPQTKLGKQAAGFFRGLDKVAGLGQVEGVLLPYINTPIRILERGLASYGPFAKYAEESLNILRNGTPAEQEIERARIELGSHLMKIGAALGLAGGITLSNGSYMNTANLDAGPPNRINLPGGGYFEIGRLDPFALTLALGAMWGQAANAGWHSYAADGHKMDAFLAFAGTALSAGKAGVLDKTYLQQLKTLTDLSDAASKGPEEVSAKFTEFLQGVFSRVVPMAGTSRQLTESTFNHQVEAVSFGDSILRSIPGGSLYLAPKRDIMGDEVKGSTMGLKFGDSQTTEGHDISPVKAKLRDLGIDLVNVSNKDGGIALTSEQVSELRRIRGKEATNDYGQTMDEALQQLFDDPEFDKLSHQEKHDKVSEAMSGFTANAKSLMETHDENYRGLREGNRLFREYRKWMGLDEAKQRASEDVKAQGLKSYLLN